MIFGLTNPLIMAPMSGITNRPFRELVAHLGADITISEMISTSAFIKNNKRSIKRALKTVTSGKYGIQLLVSSAKDLVTFFDHYDDLHFPEIKCDFFDINLGCPKRLITSQNAGASFLKKKRHDDLVKLLAAVDSTTKPVSVKIRAGWAQEDLTRIINIINNTSINFITIHSRLASQNYGIPANKEWWIKSLQLSEKPVVINGDIITKHQLEAISPELRPAGIMIGRAAWRNPLIFTRWKKKKKNEFTLLEAFNFLIDKAETFGQLDAFFVKKIALSFTRNIRNSRKIRQEINQTSNIAEIIKIVQTNLYQLSNQNSS